MLNYSKKLDRRIFIPILIILAVFLLATTMQTDLAATNSIQNTTTGGIIGALNSSNPGDTIEPDDGVYIGNNNTNMTINKDITIQGKTKDKVILDAQGLSRIFAISSNRNVTFINITFLNGNANMGGAVNNGASPGTIMNFINCNFINNTASATGGAIWTNGNLTIIDSKFINNTASTTGGGIYVTTNSITNVIIYGSTFRNNGVNDFGGGIYLTTTTGNTVNIDIVNNTFINNTARTGGGIYATNVGASITNINISDSKFIDNMGNGLMVLSGGQASITTANVINSTFTNNNASGVNVGSNGGGITNINIFNCAISGNSGSGNGGGIAVVADHRSYSNVNISYCNISGNSAGINGGGIYIRAGGNGNGTANVNISNCNINNNSAGINGGGIHAQTHDLNCSGSVNINISNCNVNGNLADFNGGAVSVYTGNGSSGDTTVVINNSTLENNNANIYGDTASVTTGENSTGSSILIITGDSSVTNNDPNKNDDGLYVFSSEGSTGNSDIIDNSTIFVKLSVNSTIVVSNIIVGSNTTICGVVTDENGNPFANLLITINIDGMDYNVTTNSAGEWSLTYIPINIGIIRIVVSSAENNVYHAFNNTETFNVKSNTKSNIVVSNATTGKQTNVSGVLVDENGNPISGASLNVVIGGKYYTVVTSTDGTWELPYTPSKAGNYNAKVYYTGDNLYLPSTGSVAYTVAQEEEDTPTKVDIRLVKRNNSKAVRHGNVVYMKWLTFKNFGASGSQTINAKIIIKNLKYKLWKVYNKKLNYKFAKNNIKFKINLKSNGIYKLKLKVYKPIK